ncbi:hypothetical protein [Streptomyces maremycinicus]|uniref:hypothetical protein n=1 Tax=Streptomyces maremycinicus TaxID=1679753 RepID=UPI0018FE8D36|nr:hypothetical protein [Streptomyces sp. NBRC 110468]
MEALVAMIHAVIMHERAPDDRSRSAGGTGCLDPNLVVDAGSCLLAVHDTAAGDLSPLTWNSDRTGAAEDLPFVMSEHLIARRCPC